MGYEEESALLEPFREEAEAGRIIEVSEIKAAYLFSQASGRQSA